MRWKWLLVRKRPNKKTDNLLELSKIRNECFCCCCCFFNLIAHHERLRFGASQPASDRRIIMFIMLSYYFVRSVVKFCKFSRFISGIQMVHSAICWCISTNRMRAIKERMHAKMCVAMKILAKILSKLINGYQHTKWSKISECKRVIKNDSLRARNIQIQWQTFGMASIYDS